MSDACQCLVQVDAAFEAMLQAIRSAARTVRLEMYIYTASPIGETFRDALVQASARGVRVQVMVDALGSVGLPDAFWNPLREAGGEFRWFNPLQLKRLSFRDHRKLLVIDETLAFVGGFNIAPEYQGDGIAKGWCDVGLSVTGALARELAASFDAMFGQAEHRHRLLARLRRSQVARAIETSGGRLLTGAPGLGPRPMLRSLLADVEQARTIDLVSAYFLPTASLLRQLRRAARSGRRVRLILAGQTDVALARRAACHLYRTMLSAGLEIYEYQPQILHAKFYLMDDRCYVGSANLDKRSLLLNYELLVRIERPELAREYRQFFETLLSHSVRIEAASWRRARNFWLRWRDRWAYYLLARIDPYLTQLQLEAVRLEQR